MAVTSASREHGDQFTACVDGELIDVDGERGIAIVVVDYHTRKVSFKHLFDTSQGKDESEQLVKLLHRVKDGNYIIMGVKGEGARKLSNEAKDAVASLGSEEIQNLKIGDSWAMIMRKGEPSSVREARQPQLITIQRTDTF